MSDASDPKTAPTGDADLEALKTRIHVYESFDSVIAENIAKAKNILVEAAELRERVTREIAQEREALNAEIADKRNRLDAEFVGLRAAFDAEINQRRDEVEAELAARRQGIDGEIAGLRVLLDNETRRHNAAKSQLATIARAILAMAQGPEPVDARSATAPEPATEATAPAADPIPEEDATPPEPVAANAVPIESPAPKTEPAKTTIIVHGIYRPMVATGLQRFLLARDGVISVEPREFAEGILRLQIRAATPITESLFTGWSDGEGMTVIQRLPQTVEIVLPTAG
jgi:hypothetical protein